MAHGETILHILNQDDSGKSFRENLDELCRIKKERPRREALMSAFLKISNGTRFWVKIWWANRYDCYAQFLRLHEEDGKDVYDPNCFFIIDAQRAIYCFPELESIQWELEQEQVKSIVRA